MPPVPTAAEAMSGRVALLGATLLAGLSAGFFWTYEVSVTLGLAEVDDAAYVQTFQAINDTIKNPMFGPVFFGTLPLLLLAAGLNWRSSSTVRRALLALAPLLFACCMAITGTGNVPLNNELAAVEPTSAEVVADARAEFEDDWNRLNLVRALAAAGGFTAAAAAMSLAPGRFEASPFTIAGSHSGQTG